MGEQPPDPFLNAFIQLIRAAALQPSLLRRAIPIPERLMEPIATAEFLIEPPKQLPRINTNEFRLE